jgi:hypothetical protein
VKSQSISDRVAALEDELSSLLAQHEDETSSSSALESQLAELQQRLAEARTRLSENETRVMEKQAELAQMKREAAAERYQEAFRAREQAAARVAGIAEQVLAELENYDEATRILQHAIDDMQAAPGDGVTAPDIEGDPEVLNAAWATLEERVRQRISEKLEDELVDEAANSAMGHAIDDLPKHLRELAHARRRSKIKSYLAKGQGSSASADELR